jgi:N-acetylneuraminic acid mutarotase
MQRSTNRLLVGLFVVALAVLGSPAVASAQRGTPTPAVGKAGAVKSCGTPDKGHVTCFALKRTDITGPRGLVPNVTPAGYGPADLRSAYALPDSGGAGATVAIVDALDDPTAEADLAVYRQQYGLPPCTTANGCFKKVDQRGGTAYPTPDQGWAGEISLDLDMVSASAPAAHILLVEADTTFTSDLATAEDYAVSAGAKFVSNSFGSRYSSTPGSGEDPTETTDFDPHFNHPGVAIVVASGDSDFGVSYPAASQYVTSVGGTSLQPASNARGWSESVWHNSYGGPGSGCSLYEPKPSFQNDTGCAQRALNDVSAVSDPATGVAVYQTFGGTGWTIYGGTSAAAPIITGVYADAGSPATNTYPNSYPYAAAGHLNDVTDGLNGTCTPAYLCTAGAGYDGPTGLGTPAGLAAFTTGPHGEVLGTVTDSGTGAPIAGASVTVGDAAGLTDAAGHYDVSVPVGTYDVTVASYGYTTRTVSGVAVADGARVTEDVALTGVPRATIDGTVTDGSGHGWPLYAKITVDGVPGGPVFTDPVTGQYELNLPQGQTYQLHVTPVYTGYQAVDRSVALGATPQSLDVAVPVDAAACDAPGYTITRTGTTEAFESPPAGWTVTSTPESVGGWVFTDDGNRGNLTGGTGGFAIIDSDHLGSGNHEDTVLTAPAVDLTGVAGATLAFDTDYRGFSNQTGSVDVSTDGGTTWTSIWQHAADSVRGPAHVEVPLPQANDLVRFHFVGTFSWWWELDNVFLGSRTCGPVAGGLVLGQTADANTGSALAGVKVTMTDHPEVNATSAATPDDPTLGDGFYWLFSPFLGSHPFAATRSHYTAAASTVNVRVNHAVEADFTLKSGRVTVTPAAIAKTVAWGATATGTITVKNTGTAPATVNLREQPGGFTPLLAGGAPLNVVKGKLSSHSLHGTAVPSGARPAAGPAAAPWHAIADYPSTIQDNLAGVFDGKVYSAYGYDGISDTTSTYAYDAGSGAWTVLAPASDTREAAAGGFINGKLYAVGGWGSDSSPDPKLEIYDPTTNAWSTGAPTPKPYAGAGSAVMGGKLYVVGGCGTSTCGTTDGEVYNPGTNSWAPIAAYPESTSWLSCGAIAGKLYCAGGTTDAGTSAHTFGYDPAANTWSALADMPADLWGSVHSAANGMLLVSGGAVNGGSAITNAGYAYDPGSDSWTALPNSNNTVFRAGSACGLYRVGGNPGGQFVPPVADSEVLPGFADCDEVTDVPWLSLSATSVTLQPGKSAKVTVTFNAADPTITQPGTLTAQVAVGTDTPYAVAPVDLAMTVNPPKTWGKITGTVTSAVDGSPIPGATVQIDTWATSYTLRTDASGQYQLWLDVRNNPLQVIVAKDGYQPQVRTVKIAKGTTTTSSFVLKKA